MQGNYRTDPKIFKRLFGKNNSKIYLCDTLKETKEFSGKLIHGVTGNTSDFGSEESRFEP
jgi:hypothetical protein